ncbi:hypothetical protein ACFQ0M_01825 [Kitasatospora aburaviensis]
MDGHDLVSFRHKLRQIELLRTLAPRLAAHYLPVVHFLDGDGWAACTTPFYDSADLAAPCGSPRRAPGSSSDGTRHSSGPWSWTGTPCAPPHPGRPPGGGRRGPVPAAAAGPAPGPARGRDDR